jgi:hypothetical protein
MEGQFQTSFIPKKPVGTPPTLGKPARTTNLFTIIVFIVFATVVLLTVAVYVYQMYLKKSNEAVQTELQTELSKLSTQSPDIDNMARLDSRIEGAKSLLAQHVALTEYFEFLSDKTLANVRFTGFKYSMGEHNMTVTMSGMARSFASLALQSDEFNKPENGKYIKGYSFTSYNLDKNGDVIFNLTSTVDQKALLYKDTITVDTQDSAPVEESSTEETE